MKRCAKKQKLTAPYVRVLRYLMKTRGIKGKDLESLEDKGVTAVTMSRTLQGVTRMKEDNLKRLAKHLCINDEERTQLFRAYHQPWAAEFELEEVPSSKSGQIDHMKAKMVMAQRAKEVRPKKKIYNILKKSGVPFEQDCLVGDISIDFMVTLHFEGHNGERGSSESIERQFAVLCHTLTDTKDDQAMVQFIKANLCIDEVILVVPHAEGTPHIYTPFQERKIEEEKWRKSFETLKKQELSEVERARKQKILINKRPYFNRTLTTESLKLYLEELQESSAPPPVTISREEQAFPKEVKARLTSQRIGLDKKKGVDCVVKRNKERVPLHYDFELRDGLQQAAEDALQLKNQLETREVAVIIPDSHGYGSITMLNGIKIIALSQLTSAELGTN